MVNRNTRDLLARCLDSLEKEREQTTDLEIVVVDSASTDGSVQAVRQRGGPFLVVELGRNNGYSFAVNRGAEGTRARYLLIMNSDVTLGRGAIESLASFLERDPARAVAGPMVTNPDGSMQRSYDRRFPGIASLLFYATGASSLAERLYRAARVRKILARLFWSRHTPLRVAWVGGACFMVRREVFEAIGGMDERFFLYCEDTDFCKRCADAGYSVHFVPRAVCVHNGNASIGKLHDSGFLSSVKSSLTFYGKHAPGLLPLARLFLVAGIAVRLLVASCLAPVSRNRSARLLRVWLCWEALEIAAGTAVREGLKNATKRIALPARRILLALLLHPGRKIDGSKGLGELRRILVLRHDGIGDMVLTLPLVTALAAGYPRARLYVLARRENAPVARMSPHVDTVLVSGRGGIIGMWGLVRMLRSFELDLVVDPMITDGLGGAFLAWVSGARYRAGFSSHGRERLFNVSGPPGEPGRDMLESMQLLARSLGAGGTEEAPGLEGLLSVAAESIQRARRALSPRGLLAGRPVLGIHPGGRFSTQRWPLERFAGVAHEVARSGEFGVLFFAAGSSTDGPGLDGPLPDGVIVLEEGSLERFMEHLSAVSLLLCNNSGPLHVARAMGIPTLSLTGPTRGAFLPRGNGKHFVIGVDLPCRPCDKPLCWHHLCLTSIDVEDVVHLVLAKLADSDGCSQRRERCRGTEGKGDR